jgi:hypothetical protein
MPKPPDWPEEVAEPIMQRIEQGRGAPAGGGLTEGG